MIDGVSQNQDIVYAFATSPEFKRDGICFAARSSGLYESEDGGTSWQLRYGSSDPENPLATFAVAVSPTFGTDRRAFAGVPGGILHTIDGGKSWDLIGLAPPTPLVSALTVSPNFAQDGFAFAGTVEDGVLVSADRGEHWTTWNFGLLDLHILAMAITTTFQSDEILFAATESGIARSTNGGRAWRDVGVADRETEPGDFAPVLCLALSPHYSTDGSMFAGTEEHGLYRSTDYGDSWVRVSETIVIGPVNQVILAPDFPTRRDILILQSDGISLSRDGGSTWSQQDIAPVENRLGLDNLPRLSAVAAPCGLNAGAPLLVGRTDGSVVCLVLG